MNDTMDAIMNIASEILNSVVIGAYSLDQELSADEDRESYEKIKRGPTGEFFIAAATALLKETREQLAAFKNFERSNCNANVS